MITCIVCKKNVKILIGKSFCSYDCANKYAREYYAKNRDKLNQYQIDYHKKKRAELNRPGRGIALKAWTTRNKKGIGMGKIWTNKEVEFLSKNFKLKKYKELGEILNRSEGAIYKKCTLLKLFKNERKKI